MKKRCSKCGGEVEPIYQRYGRRCRACRQAEAKVRRDRNPEVHRRAARKYRAANLELSRRRTRVYLWRKQGIDITLERFDELLKEQGGRCAICRSKSPGRKQGWHVDHDHDFKHVRGLLCRSCNTALGMLRDSPSILRAAAKYIERHQPQLLKVS